MLQKYVEDKDGNTFKMEAIIIFELFVIIVILLNKN